jgi:hypothetical protein
VSLKQAISALRTDLTSATIKADLQVARQETKADLQAVGEFAGERKEISGRSGFSLSLDQGAGIGPPAMSVNVESLSR